MSGARNLIVLSAPARTPTRLRLISPNLSTIAQIRSLGRQSQRMVANKEQLDSRRVRDLYPREQSEKGFVRLASEIVRTVDQRFKLIARLAEITLLAALNKLSPSRRRAGRLEAGVGPSDG